MWAGRSGAGLRGDNSARWAYEQSLDAYRKVGDERGVAVLLHRLGTSAFYRGDNERAARLAAESLSLSRELGYGVVEAQALGLAEEVEYAQGNRELGAKLIEESANLAREVRFPGWRSRMLRKLADWMLELGETSEAEACARESLQLLYDIGDRQMMVFTLVRLARIAAETGRAEDAGALWGAIETEEERSPMGARAKERSRLSAPVLVHGGPDFDRGERRGRELSFEEVVELALGRPQPKVGAPGIEPASPASRSRRL